jgi:uncharacterized protein YdeI (BOF family)
MENTFKILIITGAIALVSTTALADNAGIKKMKDGTKISVTGTVDSVQNEREFTLRDESGIIPVKVQSNDAFTISAGEKVTVTGEVDKSLFRGTDIKANSVDVHKDLATTLGDAIDAHTPISVEGAKNYKISELPNSGMVKVSGTVYDVDNEKSFKLKDASGAVNIQLKSAESVALTEGAQVAVVGYMDKGALGRDINATRVVVISNGVPSAGN